MGDVGELSGDMEWEWPIWRICLSKSIPLKEVKYEWSLTDIHKALDFMEMESDYQAAENALMMRDLEIRNMGKK